MKTETQLATISIEELRRPRNTPDPLPPLLESECERERERERDGHGEVVTRFTYTPTNQIV